jgi:tRNA modification GTPase
MTRLGAMIIPHNQAQNSAIITRLRHRQSLRDAHDALCAGLRHDFHKVPELAAEDFRQAATALGRITGDVDVEELLGQIFSSFCIGK